MKNEDVANLFYEIADILEIQDVKFKPQAYRRAAQNIESLGENIEEVHKKGKLRDIPGIGEAIAKKIGEFLDTGELKYLDKLKQEVPEGLLMMLEIPGLGPKKVALLYKELGISDVQDLKSACENHMLEGIKGLGAKTEENILRGIKLLESSKDRYLLHQALMDGEALKQYLNVLKAVKKIELAGSLRRMKETVGDIDILVSSQKQKAVMNRFVDYEEVAEVVMKGDTKSSIRLKDGVQVDLRVVPKESFGAALQYFTGSKEHNVKLRKLAISKGLKINEYGVFKKDSDERIAGDDEKKVYAALGLNYVEPELREDRGEVELALKSEIPRLIELADIKGDLQVHTEWSDGISSIKEMAEEAKKRGYLYMAVTDHSESLKIAGGLSKKRLLEQIEEIHRVNRKISDFRVFSSIECNINSNGTLDIKSEVMNEVDFIIGAVHSGFSMSEDAQTKRIIKAMENETMKILAHPTGRMLKRREAFKVNIEKIVESANANDVFLEINAFPVRLDLNDINVKYAKEKGAKFVISTDTHKMAHLDFMRFGVATARRGWLEKKDVINTLPTRQIEKLLRGR
ncbi:MAG: DNA polymerase/3'-5' exonuclease PolX [Methanomassiliicoccales archaeon]|nr:MAG: DNA polymerase/3'-5' exonuclease PolX [Methanomassiliicoccales archaeon]